MKEGWRMVKLGEVCKIKGGSTPIKSNKLYWENGTIPWFTVADIREQGRIIKYTNKSITELAAQKLCVYPVDTILLCCTASVGEYAITKIETTSNQQFNGLMIKDKSILSPEYLFHLVSTLKDVLLKLSGKTTIDFVSVSKVSDIEIPLPPLEEQHRIVSILDASFEKIDALKKNAEENLKNAKALFQQVLAQELKPKEGWVEKKLGEVCSKIGSGATPHGGKDSYKEEGISLIRSLNIYDNEFIYDDLAHIDDKQADELNNVIIEKNDVLFNITGASVTRCCIVPNKILPARVNQHVSILRPQNGVLTNVFLCYLMISMKDYLIKLAFSKGATRQAITKKQLEDLMIAYPNDINEQMSIVNTINTLSEKCRRLEQVAQQTIRECDALKQSILRQAFSGEL